MTLRPRQWRSRFVEQFELQPDAARALRGVVAFTVPVAVCHALNRPIEGVFVSTAALNLALPDLRGAYRVRIGLLASMTLLAAVSALVGSLTGGNVVLAVAAMALVAVGGGVWRHLSADYGPGMAVSSALLFLLGLSRPGGWSDAMDLARWTVLGGVVATVVHGAAWLFRPQHALRSAVAETWVAASDLTAALRPGGGQTPEVRHQQTARLEGELRAALDRTFVILGAAETGRQASLVAHLERVRREVVHFSMRMIAFNTALEPMLPQSDFAPCLPVVDSVLKALGDASRSVAITLMMHRAENFEASNLRLRRCQHLIHALDEQLAALPCAGEPTAQVRATLAEVEGVLPRIRSVLEETAVHAGTHTSFGAGLPDLSARSVQSLAGWVRPAARLDPVLVRHSVRLAVFTMLAVGLYKGFDLPRGYWIALTIMVVLQPDYGSTRQRAVARIGGTVAGCVAAGLLVRLHVPVIVLDALAALAACGFSYFLKRRYWLAILFVTINLVLITETLTPVGQDFMVMRVVATLAGGALALVAARIFWPIWEGALYPALLATAIRANRTFLLSLSGWFGLAASDTIEPLMAKRRAENANRYVAASVDRLQGEPAALRENVERAAALATYNQRVTRALTLLAVHVPESGTLGDPALAAVVGRIAEELERLARAFEGGNAEAAARELTAGLRSLEGQFASIPPAAAAGPARLAWVQVGKTIAEIRAMTLAA